MSDVTPFSAEEVGALPRGTIRYALFRRRTGAPDEQHWKIINYFEPRLKQYGLAWADFSETWDLSKDNPLDVVSGHIVHMYKQENTSLFNEDGTLKQ